MGALIGKLAIFLVLSVVIYTFSLSIIDKMLPMEAAVFMSTLIAMGAFVVQLGLYLLASVLTKKKKK